MQASPTSGTELARRKAGIGFEFWTEFQGRRKHDKPVQAHLSFMVDGFELMLLGTLAAITYAMGLWKVPTRPLVPSTPPLEPYPWQPAPPTPPALAEDSEECKRLYDAYVAFRRSGDSGSAYAVREDARKRLGCKWAGGSGGVVKPPEFAWREPPTRIPGGLFVAAGTALGASPAVGGTGTPTATGTSPTRPGGGGTSGGARLIL